METLQRTALTAVAPWPDRAADPAGRVLVIEDEAPIRDLLVQVLDGAGHEVVGACDGAEAETRIEAGFAPAVALLDIHLPGRSGLELLAWLRQRSPETQVVMSTGVQDLATVRFCLREGAYDYLLKPFDPAELLETVSRALDRGEQVRAFRRQQEDLETAVARQSRALESTRELALLAMARLAESRDRETGLHLDRMAELSVILARALRAGPYGDRVTDDFLERLRVSAPLHDVGKVGIPDAVLLKEGPLTDHEWAVIRRHAEIGGDTLRSLAKGHDEARLLEMAVDIAYQHHERWNGSGYPRGLAGEEIDLAARIVALVDAYDAITSERPYKRAFEHKEAVRRIALERGRHFDPVVVDAFMACHREIDRARQALRGDR